MNSDVLFSVKDKRLLQKAREVYGPQKELGVAAEECIELAKELIKVLRYDDFFNAVEDTKEKVVEEVADVIIVLDHIIELYHINEYNLIPHVHRKMKRLEYWLENSNSIEFTTKHREESE